MTHTPYTHTLTHSFRRTLTHTLSHPLAYPSCSPHRLVGFFSSVSSFGIVISDPRPTIYQESPSTLSLVRSGSSSSAFGAGASSSSRPPSSSSSSSLPLRPSASPPAVEETKKTKPPHVNGDILQTRPGATLLTIKQKKELIKGDKILGILPMSVEWLSTCPFWGVCGPCTGSHKILSYVQLKDLVIPGKKGVLTCYENCVATVQNTDSRNIEVSLSASHNTLDCNFMDSPTTLSLSTGPEGERPPPGGSEVLLPEQP